MAKDRGDGEREPLRKTSYEREPDTGKGGSRAALPDIHLWTSRPTRRCGKVIVHYRWHLLSILRRSNELTQKREAPLGGRSGASYGPYWGDL